MRLHWPINGRFVRRRENSTTYFIISRILGLSSLNAKTGNAAASYFISTRVSPPRFSTLHIPCRCRDAMRLARQFMRGELLRSRIARVRLATSTVRNPAFDIPPTLLPHLSFSPSSTRTTPSMFVLIIIHRATTVAQRLLLADYSPGRSRNRPIVCSLETLFSAVSLARARKHARVNENKRSCHPMEIADCFEEFNKTLLMTLIS